MRRVLAIALLSGLSSCGQSADEFQAAPPAAASAGKLQLDARGVPKFRAGLWEVTRSDSSSPGETELEKECIGENASEELARALNSESDNCTVSKSGGASGIRVVSECLQSGSKIKSELSISGGDTAYEMRLKIGIVTPDGKSSGGETIDKARWIGACPAGMSPGDSVGETEDDQ